MDDSMTKGRVISHDQNSAPEFAVLTKDLTKRYARGSVVFDALSHMDLAVKRGEFVAIMGASGSGKSTALHLMAGLTRPSVGSVEIEGRNLMEMSDRELTIFRRRRIGVVFQNYNLIPHMTAQENILLPLRADRRKLDATLMTTLRDTWERLGIVSQLEQFPDALSGGQQQRVALARALAIRPAVLLADEPTGNLDRVASLDVCEILSALNREENCTIVLVTHEPAAAIWSDRIVILRDGRIEDEVASNMFQDAGSLAAYYQEIARRDDAKESSAQ